MGLESIIDTVKFLEVHEIEDYLSGLKEVQRMCFLSSVLNKISFEKR